VLSASSACGLLNHVVLGVYLYCVMWLWGMEDYNMPREDGKRNFALREDGTETSIFSGNTPRQAALKAARRLDPAGSQSTAETTELRLREKGTEKVHVYEGWAWEAEAPSDAPDWMPERITKANVSKEGIVRLEER